jgi:energy-coupling factor transport system ATP-binding protein
MPLISVEQLTWSYIQSPTPALREVSFEVEFGTVTCIVGANGSGKTTLCYALAGFIPHFFKGEMQGRVRVNEVDTKQTPLAELVTQVGLAFQNPFNQISGAKLTVAEEVAFGLENLGVPRAEMQTRVERALDLVGLHEAAGQSPFALSGGQQQRLALASIFVMEPRVMVLDEPTAQLDPQGTREVMGVIDTLARQGHTIVLVEHKLEWVARIASRVLVLDRGLLAADGTPREILARADQWGLNETRYARVARLARERGLTQNAAPLPQTLEEAKHFFEIAAQSQAVP